MSALLLSSGAYPGSASGTGRHSLKRAGKEPGWARIKPPSPVWINTRRYGTVTQVYVLSSEFHLQVVDEPGTLTSWRLSLLDPG